MADTAKIRHLKNIDLPFWQNGGTNYTSVLFTLIARADNVNIKKLAVVYPDEVAVYLAWYRQTLDIEKPDT